MSALVLEILTLTISWLGQSTAWGQQYEVPKAGLKIDGEITDSDPKLKSKQVLREMHGKTYVVSLVAGTRYAITLDKVKDGLDPFLILQDDQGNMLAFDDDGGGMLNSKLFYTIAKTSDYKVTAAAFGGNGPFVLRIVEAPLEVHAVGSDGLVLKGAIAPKDPKVDVPNGKKNLLSKLFDVKLLADRQYTFLLEAGDVGLDPLLILQDAGGKALGVDDDGGGFYNAKLLYTPPSNETVKVYAAAARGSGAFTLRVFETTVKRQAVAKGGLSIDDEVKAADPKIHLKEMPGPMPAKSYSLDLKKGQTYLATLTALRPELDPYLVVQGPDGKVIGVDDDGGGFPNAKLTITAPADGTYQFHAATLRGAGPFSLKVGEASGPGTVNLLRQGFPVGKCDMANLEASDTAWEIEWTTGRFEPQAVQSQMLVIRSAKFMFKDKTGQPHWLTVLKNLTVGEIFVPYNPGNPQFLDVSKFQFALVPLTRDHLGPACVAPGEILSSPVPEMKNKVAKEIHDDGIRWMNSAGLARRGERMILWSVLSAGNYSYIQEYGFGDDGTLVCRLGPTAHNLNNFEPDNKEKGVHLHMGCWRWDPELAETSPNPVGGSTKNRVVMVRRLPVPQQAGKYFTDITPFNSDGQQASEGFEDLKPDEYPVLRVESLERKNSSGRPGYTAYDLIPMRIGNARNFAPAHEFANHEFWVTQKRDKQPYFRDVPNYAKQRQLLEGAPLTIWHSSALQHIPRAEDFGADGLSRQQGVAIVGWVGFTLRPVNLFDSTPLYSQPKLSKISKN